MLDIDYVKEIINLKGNWLKLSNDNGFTFLFVLIKWLTKALHFSQLIISSHLHSPFNQECPLNTIPYSRPIRHLSSPLFLRRQDITQCNHHLQDKRLCTYLLHNRRRRLVKHIHRSRSTLHLDNQQDIHLLSKSWCLSQGWHSRTWAKNYTQLSM